MRLDHLLSKELLATGCCACMGVVVVVSVAHCAGVCSAVGAHGWNISKSSFLAWPLVVVSWREYGGPFFAFVCGGLLGKRSGVLVAGLCLAHCWVLRQQGLFAAMQGILGVSCCSCGRHPLAWFVWGGCG